MSVSVVTSITGGKDTLIESHKAQDATFIAYTDVPIESKLWERREAYNRFLDPRRNSRIHKILIHQYVDTDYSIWVDGNIELLKSPEELIDLYLKDHDIMMFKHESNDCVYDEAMTCAKRGLDDPEIIIEQAKAYEDRGYGKHKGLYVGNFIIRRHTHKMEMFNNAWWSEYSRHSVRDQISLPYCLDKLGLRVNVVDAPWKLVKVSDTEIKATRGDAIRIYPHIILNPTAV